MVPSLAALARAVTNPWALAILIAGLAGSFVIAAGPPARDLVRRAPANLRALRTGAIETARDPRRARQAAAGIAWLPHPAIAYGMIGLALAGWSVYAFTQSTTEMKTVQRTQLEHVTSIGYVARGTPSVALPDGVASPVSSETVALTGEQPPLYPSVLSAIDFGFQYELRSSEPLSVLGFAGTALRIKAQDGWERTIVLQPAQPLVGPQVTMWFTADLDAVRLIIAGVELETGSQSSWYDLTVVPVVRLAGQQGDAHIDETYSREFNLRYDRARITPDPALDQTARKIETARLEAPRQVDAFGLAMETRFARWVAAIGALIALAGAAMIVATRGHTSAIDAASPGVARPSSLPLQPAPSTQPAATTPTETAAIASAPSSVQEAAHSSDAPDSNAIADELTSLAARVAEQATAATPSAAASASAAMRLEPRAPASAHPEA